MNNVKVYVIIINYNAVEDTIECLETLYKQRFNNIQTVVVDNSTENGTLEKIKCWADGQWNSEIKTQYSELVFPLCNKPITCNVISENKFNKAKQISDELILVKAKRNNGFAAANNIALNYIKQDTSEVEKKFASFDATKKIKFKKILKLIKQTGELTSQQEIELMKEFGLKDVKEKVSCSSFLAWVELRVTTGGRNIDTHS